MSLVMEAYIPGLQENGFITGLNATFNGNLTVLGTTTIAAMAINGATTITSTSANALTVGRQGATAPVLQVDASTSSVATGVAITGAAAASGVAIAAISSGTDESLSINAKGAGLTSIGGTSTGLVKIGQGSAKQLIQGGAVVSLGTAQNSSPTAAQLLAGVVTQTSSTGAGTVTTPTGTQLSSAITGVATGDSFHTRFANLGGGQTLTITAGASGISIVGTATVATGTNIDLLFVCTGTNTWVCYTNK